MGEKGRKGDELEDVRFRRVGYYIGRWVLLDCLVFTSELSRVSEPSIERSKEGIGESYSFIRSPGGHCKEGIYFENEIFP